MSDRFDVAVIGGGILGTAVSARLSRTTASVVLLEEAEDLAEGSSKGNAGIVCSYYSAPETLEGQLVSRSYRVYEDLCRRLDVPYRRCGSLTLAMDRDQAATLPALLAPITAAGVAAEIISGDDARQIEPLVSDEATAALYQPDEAIVDPMRLTVAFAELAARNGAQIRRSAAVTGATRMADGEFRIHTEQEDIRARFVVNAAGMAAGQVSALFGGDSYDLRPRQGQYWVLDREFGRTVKSVVVTVPQPDSRGIQLVPTTNRSALLGPDSRDTTDPYDRSTAPDVLEAVFATAQRMIPSVRRQDAIKSYAANRIVGQDGVRLRLDAQQPGLLHVGNRSTGVTTSPATAEDVLSLLRQAGLVAPDRPGSVTELPKTRRLLFDESPETLVRADPRYAQVVCVCEQVTAAEIDAAFRSAVPPVSLEGVRKRTRATYGRCQGAFCSAGVSFMCALNNGYRPDKIRQGSGGATLGVGRE
jgi:glycerol-3-phosphate dehydrogenase